MAVAPSQLTGFVNGVWAGPITVGEPATNVVLTVTDADAHRGDGTIPLVLASAPAPELVPSTPLLLNPGFDGTHFRFSLQTIANRRYVVEYSASLHPPAWVTALEFVGDGSKMEVRDEDRVASHRLYRVRVE